MQWTPDNSNPDIEDRRNESGGGGGGFGFGGGGGFGGMHLGIGGTLILLVLSFLFKTNLFQFFDGNSGTNSPSQRVEQTSNPDPDRDQAEQAKVGFVGGVLKDIQDTWDRRLPEAGRQYRHAKLTLFRDSIASGCGQAQSATGPFYCPEDEKVYVDLGFFDDLKNRFGAPGEFAQAYVIAHEVGHHVQKILGVEAQVRRAQQRNPQLQNQYSVRLELQADCFAGVWASRPETPNMIDRNDVEAGLRAAAAVGDDRLQKMGRGRVSPESFTHGSSAQRMQWFRTGLENGTVAGCNTFAER